MLFAFKLFRFDTPRFPNLWKAACAVGAALLGDGLLGSLAILGAALVGAFIAYEKTLETADGELMGSKAAAVALGAHSVFSTLSFLFVFPAVMGALT
jgi:hypothetical protein